MKSHDFPNSDLVLPVPDKGIKYGLLSGVEAGKRGFLPAKVFVNGIETPDCVLFDDNEGWADVYDREDGHIVVNEKGDGPRVKRLFGEIKYYPKGTY